MGQEHVHATTYFATRILYQRGKLDLPGVVARLRELVERCPEFGEARAMLGAAERGTLRPDPRGFIEATLPPPAVDARIIPEDDESDRPTHPGPVLSSLPALEARLKTPQAPPGIPRAPLVPRFTPRDNVAPSYAPPPEAKLTPPELECLNRVMEQDLPHKVRGEGWTVQGWPVPDRPFRRVVLRAVPDDV